MKVVLVNPAHTVAPPAPNATLSSGVVPPSSLLSVAAALPRDLIDVVLVDLNLHLAKGSTAWGSGFFEYCVETILRESPDVVAFTAFGSDYPAVFQTAKLLKKSSDAFVVLGGAQASAVPEASLAWPQVDAVVMGEGEYAFRDLCLALRDGVSISTVPGLAYRRGGLPARTGPRALADLDALPFPALDLIDLNEYRALNQFRFYYDIGRGCPFACNFCSTSLTYGRTFRMKSPAKIVDELSVFIEQYGIDRFFFTHDLFTTNRRVVIDICDAILDRGIQPRWKCFSRCDTLDSELLRRMKAAGCEDIFFGVESGSSHGQKALNKNLDLQHDLQIVKEASAELKNVAVGMIAGFPAETEEGLEETMALSLHLKLNWVDRAGLNLLMPLSGTKIARDNAQNLVLPMARADFPEFLRDAYDDIQKDPSIFTFFYYVPHQTRTYDETIFLLNVFNDLVLRVFPYTVAYVVKACRLTITQLLQAWRAQCGPQPSQDATDPELFSRFLIEECGALHVAQWVSLDIALHRARAHRGTEFEYDFDINVDQIAEALREDTEFSVDEGRRPVSVIADHTSQSVRVHLADGVPTNALS